MIDLKSEQDKLNELKEKHRDAEVKKKEELELKCVVAVLESVTLSSEILGVMPIEILNKVVDELQLTAMKPLLKLVGVKPELTGELPDGAEPYERPGVVAIPGAPNRYVSRQGIVDTWMSKNGGGYVPLETYPSTTGRTTNLPYGSEGKYHKVPIAQLVAEAFIPKPDDSLRYKVGRKDKEAVLDDGVDNLKWIRDPLKSTKDFYVKTKEVILVS